MDNESKYRADDFTQIDDDFNYIIDTAKEMGITVTYVTPINVKFIAKLIRRLKEKVNELERTKYYPAFNQHECEVEDGKNIL